MISRFSGVSVSSDSAALVERRLRDRVAVLGLTDYTAYETYLRREDAGKIELEHAVELLTSRETYFFREWDQLDTFSKHLLPEMAKAHRSGKHLVIWSAGCSTGEEAYTLAILIADSALFDGWSVRIFGSDISRRAVRTARAAVYGPASFRELPSGFEKYFLEAAKGRSPIPSVKAMCHFAHLNLLDPDALSILGRVHAVFCRNVLIYFDPGAKERVIRAFGARLGPGGLLLLGHSEFLAEPTKGFEMIKLDRALAYRRTEEGQTK